MTLRAVIWAAVSTKSQADEDERISLPKQESDARALAEREGWQVVDVLRVPGHSRHYIDIYECARDMAKEGIDAFNRLLDHWNRKDFDVLIVRDGDRFARTQSLHAFVTEKTISIGARIYSLTDGWVDENNYRMWISMVGYRAASDIDRLLLAKDAGLTRRAERGLNTAMLPFSHKILRDDSGKAVKVVPDEIYRAVLDDAARLLVDRVSWHDIALTLYERGYVSPKGTFLSYANLWRLFHNPWLWGNAARKWNGGKRGFGGGLWSFDPSEPAPPDAIVFYNTHEPFFTGDFGERIKAELRRRRNIRGRADPAKSKRFAGLLLCAECERHMAYHRYKDTESARYRCKSHLIARFNPGVPVCSQRKTIREDKVQAWIDTRLREMLAAKDPTMFLPDESSQEDAQRRVESIAREITDVEGRIRRMIQAQSQVDGEMYQYYANEIHALGQQLKALRSNLAEAQRHTASAATITSQTAAYDIILQLSVDDFWLKDDAFVNQTLHRLMVNRRLVVMDGEIIGTATDPRRV